MAGSPIPPHLREGEFPSSDRKSPSKFDASYVSHVENGTKVPTRAFAERADDAFKLPGTFVILHKVLELGEQDSETVADIEQDALALIEWDQRVITGILQTPGYARAHLSTSLPPERVERELAVRLKRQKVLGALVAGWFVLDESVLRRVYGGADVMRGQLVHLEDVAARPNIGVQVMPYTSTRHPGSYGPLRVIEYADKPAVLLTEGPGSGRLSSDQKVVLVARHDLDEIKTAALSVHESVEYIRHIRETTYERQLA